MKLAISPWGIDDEWDDLPIGGYHFPSKIRERVRSLLEAEEEFGYENKFCTLNRTVLDMVHDADAKHFEGISYEDVFVLKDNQLVPLLSLYSKEWLCHFALGDVFERDF